MEKTTKRIVISIMLEIFLLTACAPAQAVSQDQALMQKLAEQSAVLTSVAQTLQAQDQQLLKQSEAFTAAVPTPLSAQQLLPSKTESPPAGPDSSNQASGNVEIPSGPGQATQSSETVEIPTAPDSETASPETEQSLEEESDAKENDFDFYCKPSLEKQLAVDEIEKIIEPLKSQMAKGKKATINFPHTVTIIAPVNLRTQPSLLNRIILVLKPGTEVDIIDGPKITLYKNGTQYVWWKVKFGEFTGWSAEVSACGQFYFMGPVSSETPKAP